MKVFDPVFGRLKKGESPLDFVFEAIDGIDAPLTRTEARVYLAEIYETKFGIYNHATDKSRPLASVGVHDAEKYIENSYWRSSMRKYFTQKVYEKTGMSPTQFMDLPVNYSKLLLEELTVLNKQDENAANSAEEEMRRQLHDATHGGKRR